MQLAHSGAVPMAEKLKGEADAQHGYSRVDAVAEQLLAGLDAGTAIQGAPGAAGTDDRLGLRGQRLALAHIHHPCLQARCAHLVHDGLHTHIGVSGVHVQDHDFHLVFLTP